jgi:putative membrane protein
MNEQTTPAPAAPTSGEIATQLAHERTNLAMERNFLADERTLMAWIRTALSMISFGFTIAKLGQAMHDVEVKKLLGGFRVVGVRRIGDFLVVLGTLALLAAAIQHWHRLRKLHAMGFKREISITFIVAVLLVIGGGLAFFSLVSNL